jgi:hypothetical protein
MSLKDIGKFFAQSHEIATDAERYASGSSDSLEFYARLCYRETYGQNPDAHLGQEDAFATGFVEEVKEHHRDARQLKWK